MAKIIWTEPALYDLDSIADHIALDKPLAARALVKKIFDKVQLLKKFPRLGNIPPELKKLPYRQISIVPCRVFYRIQQGKIMVIAVHRGERRIGKDLLAARSM